MTSHTPPDIFSLPSETSQPGMPGGVLSSPPHLQLGSPHSHRFDSFVPSTIQDIGNIPAPSTLGGVRPILAQAAAVFSATAGNSNPVFRFAMCEWILGMLGSANSVVETALQDPNIRNTPLGREAITLNGIIKGLIGLVKGMYADKTETIKGNQQIAKGFQELGKSA